jgi:hypothetical protein
MHFKSFIVRTIEGEAFATMIFARALALLPLPDGCLA